WYALLVQGHDGGQGGIDGIAVIGSATAIELAVFIFWRPGPQVGAPAGELRLLVQMAIHQHRIAAVLARGRSLEVDDRGPAWQAYDLQLPARYLLRLDPLRGIAHHPIYIGILGPVCVEGRTLGRYRNVIGQRGNDLAVPFLVHES